MKPKIGIVTEYYYPLLGGITENVYNTKIRLEKIGYAVKIITPNCNGTGFRLRGKIDSDDQSVIRLGHSVPFYSNGSFAHFTVGVNLAFRMREILLRERFDLLHLHSPLVFTLPGLALVLAKCPLVGTFHTYFTKSIAYSMFRVWIQRLCITKLKGQIAVSQSCVDALSRYFKINPRIIPNGVDTDRFNPAASRFEKFDHSKMNLLFLSRLDPRNGLGLMLRVFELVKSKFSDVRLIVVGDGPLRFYYERLVPKEFKNDVHFEGLAQGERPRYYASCDVFCSPVTKASFGVTLLEAMASGRPIIATENIGYKEILDPKTGFLIPPNAPGEFADKIVLLLNDERLRREMGANGREKALEYSWDKIVRQVVELYQGVLNN